MRKWNTDKRWMWEKAFCAVINAYETAKAESYFISAEGFYEDLESGKSSSENFNPRIISPSGADFCCDVEMAGRRVLTDAQYALFEAVFLQQRYPSEVLAIVRKNEVHRREEQRMKEKLGRAFVAHRIYPISHYFKVRDLR